jgi:hypothetical protein
MRTLIIASLLVPGTAAAEGFLEGHLGLAVPFEDGDYENATDESFKFGIRAGALMGNRGFDLAFDYTPVNDNLDSDFLNLDVGVSRFRILAGGRFGTRVAPKVNIVARVAAGTDIVRYKATGMLLGTEFEQSETDVGIALELAGGFMVDVTPTLALGGWLGVPMAFHFEEDDPDDNMDADLDYAGFDIDVTFVATLKF